MRRLFVSLLYEKMKENQEIFLVTADLGYKMFDQIRDDFSERLINVGAAEQCMLGVGVGLALENKIPILYSITPFLLFRGAETIRNYINHEKIPVKLVGSGRGEDYIHDGFSHWAGDDLKFMKVFENIICFHPDNKEDVIHMFNQMIYIKKPFYLNLKR